VVGPDEILTMAFVLRSLMNTSRALFVSPETRFEAQDMKPTKRPSPEIVGLWLKQFACCPEADTDTRVVVLAVRSRTKMSSSMFVSLPARLSAFDPKAT
jgi:hypothetical protein